MKRAQESNPGKDLDPLTAAYDAFDDHNYSEAIARAEKILQDNPNEGHAWYIKGNSLFELNRHEEAIPCFEKAASLDPSLFDADIWTDKGNLLFALPNYALAVECYERAIQLDDDYKWGWRNKGLACYNLKQYAEALRCINKAIEIDPDYADPWVDKGNLYTELGSNNEALPCYDRAIELDPENVWAWTNKGWVLVQIGSYPDALKCYDRAIELDPDRVETWNEKGLLLNNMANYTEAIRCFEKASEIDPSFGYAWRNRASALEVLGKQEEAKNSYLKALEVSEKVATENTRDTNIGVMRSACYLNLGDVASAERELYQILERDPKNLEAMNNLVSVYGDYKFEFDKALEYMRRILAINPTNSGYRLNYVEILLKNNCYEEARDLAMELLNEITVDYQVCLLRLFILLSLIFEGSKEEMEKGFNNFVESFENMNELSAIREDLWTFRGLVTAISRTSTPAFYKFYALTLIDLTSGKIDSQDLSYSQLYLPRETSSPK